MMRNIVGVILVLLFSLLSFALVLAAEEELDKGLLIISIDAEKLMKNSLPEYEKLERRYITSAGVTYFYYCKDIKDTVSISGKGRSLRKGRSFTIGVFKDNNIASDIFRRQAMKISAGPTLAKMKMGNKWLYNGKIYDGESKLLKEVLGDEIACWPSTILLRRRNVVVYLGLGEKRKDEILKVAEEIDRELESGTLFVTRGEKVELPEISLVDLPATIKLGKRITCRIEVTNMDPADILIGSDYAISPGVVTRSGKTPEIIYHAPKIPKEAGKKIISISAATSSNVVTTKEFTIEVEKE